MLRYNANIGFSEISVITKFLINKFLKQSVNFLSSCLSIHLSTLDPGHTYNMVIEI